MKKLVVFIFILAIVAVFITGCSGNSRNTIKKGVLMIGINIDYPPMEYIADDGITPIGFDVSLSKLYIRNTLALVTTKNARHNVRSPRDLSGMDLVSSVRQ